MIKPLAMLVFLALGFFFFYFLWKKKIIYSLFIALVFLALFAIGVYFSANVKNNYCTTPHKTFSERPLKLETAKDYFKLGNYMYDLGKCDEAIADYTKAIELDPTISQIYNNRGFTYLMKEDYKNALGDFNKAIEIRPNYVHALMNRGDIYNYYYSIDRQKAIADYEKVIAQGPWVYEDTAVCGHLTLARNNGWSPMMVPKMFSLALSGGKNCK